MLKDNNAVTPLRLEPAALRSRVKHSTTEPLRSLNIFPWQFCSAEQIRLGNGRGHYEKHFEFRPAVQMLFKVVYVFSGRGRRFAFYL